MGIFLFIIALVVISILMGGCSVFGGIMNPFSMVVTIVAISVFGGVLREIAKNRKGVSNAAQKDLEEIKQRMTQIEANIDDIKEQIADFIIGQV